jgi:hypothetical protein
MAPKESARSIYMNPKHIREIRTNEVLWKRLAKFIALHCFRNTDVLEDLHSGEVPISESGDHSDVKVITPSGEIPWSDLSRFGDREMKALMIDVVNRGELCFNAPLYVPAEAGSTFHVLKSHGRDAFIAELERLSSLGSSSPSER